MKQFFILVWVTFVITSSAYAEKSGNIPLYFSNKTQYNFVTQNKEPTQYICEDLSKKESLTVIVGSCNSTETYNIQPNSSKLLTLDSHNPSICIDSSNQSFPKAEAKNIIYLVNSRFGPYGLAQTNSDSQAFYDKIKNGNVQPCGNN